MREISCCAKFPREFYRRAIASNTSLSVMNSLSEHIILVFMLKLFVSVLEHLCTNDNVHFHIASSHVITQIEYALVLFSMFASRNILNRKTNSVGIEKIKHFLKVRIYSFSVQKRPPSFRHLDRPFLFWTIDFRRSSCLIFWSIRFP